MRIILSAAIFLWLLRIGSVEFAAIETFSTHFCCSYVLSLFGPDQLMGFFFKCLFAIKTLTINSD